MFKSGEKGPKNILKSGGVEENVKKSEEPGKNWVKNISLCIYVPDKLVSYTRGS